MHRRRRRRKRLLEHRLLQLLSLLLLIASSSTLLQSSGKRSKNDSHSIFSFGLVTNVLKLEPEFISFGKYLGGDSVA